MRFVTYANDALVSRVVTRIGANGRVMSAVKIIKAGDLEIQIREAPKAESPAGIVGIVPLGEMQRRYVRHVLEQCSGNKSRAARSLGISRRSLYRMLEVQPCE